MVGIIRKIDINNQNEAKRLCTQLGILEAVVNTSKCREVKASWLALFYFELFLYRLMRCGIDVQQASMHDNSISEGCEVSGFACLSYNRNQLNRWLSSMLRLNYRLTSKRTNLLFWNSLVISINKSIFQELMLVDH